MPGPDTRVVELRVHGILGTTPELLTDAVAAIDVAGDGVGRIVRPADRLRRPAPGPGLQASGRSIPRVVEGYLWGRMTSGGGAQATWALLFPFILSNVAHWMLPPIPENHRLARGLGLVLRSLLRIAALLLTMLFIAQLTVTSLDLFAAQCLAPGSSCLGNVPDWTRDWPGLRPVVGLLPVAVVIFVLHRVSTVDWDVDVPQHPVDRPARQMPRLPGAGVATDPDTPALRALHAIAAMSTASLLALGGPAGPSRPSMFTPWIGAIVLLAIAVLAVLLLDDPTGGTPDRAGAWLRAALGRVPRQILMALSTALFVATAAMLHPLPAKLPGSDATVESIAAGLAACCVLVGLLLVPAALVARTAWRELPRELRPWAGGWMAAPVLTLAALLGGGFGAGVAITLRRVLGRDGLELPPGYQWITLLWGSAAVLGMAVIALMLAFVLLLRWLAERGGWTATEEVPLLHAGRTEDAKRAKQAWWWAELERRHVHHALLVIAMLLAIGTGVAIVFRVLRLQLPSWTNVLSGIGVVALASLAVGLLRVVYLAVRQPQTARQLGILADLASFWPREAHPTIPPCYALKVVPELVARATDHLKDPGTRLVFVGHSQGSLLAAVAAARLLESLEDGDRERVGLVTVGSQLQWAYPRAFPAVVPHASLAELAKALDGRWRSLCRGTDPLGGAVTTWSRQVYGGMLLGVGFRSDGSEGPLPPAARSPSGALVLGGDHWLPDPQRGPFPGQRWCAGVLGHFNYPSDPEWDRAVARAAGLE